MSNHLCARFRFGKAAGIVPAILLLLALSGCNRVPPHVLQVDGKYQLEAGYTWISDPEHDLHVRWNPGSTDPAHPHIFAAENEGKWVPAGGYDWVNPSSGLEVVWSPGSTLNQYPHVRAGNTEGQWLADAGYTFVSKGSNDLTVRWTPGRTHPDHPHVVANDNEGFWVPDDGYTWTDKDRLLVAWSPGSTSSQLPHIYASLTEGYWKPYSGYRFVNRDSLDVERDSIDYSRVFKDVIIAAAGKQLSEGQDTDSPAMTFIGRPLAKAIGDAASDDAKDALRGR